MRASIALAIALVSLTAGSAAADELLAPYDEAPPAVGGPALAPAPVIVVPAAPAVPPPVIAPLPMVAAPSACLTYYCGGGMHYREVDQPRYGLMIAGMVILGASWSINAATAWVADEWRLAVPVAGPFMETQRIDTSPGHGGERMLVGLLVFDGLIETAGAALLVAGAVTHHKVRILDHSAVSFVPTAGASSAGLAAFGHF